MYISGFVAKAVHKKLKCVQCLPELIVEKENIPYSFLHFKNRPDFTYPSQNIILICEETEKVIRRFIQVNEILNSESKNKIFNEVFSTISTNQKIFQNFNDKHTSKLLENHKLSLIKQVTLKYIDLRLRYNSKQISAKESIRNHYKKIVFLKGNSNNK